MPAIDFEGKGWSLNEIRRNISIWVLSWVWRKNLWGRYTIKRAQGRVRVTKFQPNQSATAVGTWMTGEVQTCFRCCCGSGCDIKCSDALPNMGIRINFDPVDNSFLHSVPSFSISCHCSCSLRDFKSGGQCLMFLGKASIVHFVQAILLSIACIQVNYALCIPSQFSGHIHVIISGWSV